MSLFNKLRYLLTALVLTAGVQTVDAQRVSLKTNGLYWLGASPNLGVELRMSRRFTLDVEAAGNPFTFNDFKTRHATFYPELRYWFAGRPQVQHFVGFMGIASAYDLHLKGWMHKGDAFGVGLTYGYCFALSKHWSLETTLGLGVLRYLERKYKEGTANPGYMNHRGWVSMPTKIGVSVVYIIK